MQVGHLLPLNSAMLDRVSRVQKEPIMLRIKIATFLKIDFKKLSWVQTGHPCMKDAFS